MSTKTLVLLGLIFGVLSPLVNAAQGQAPQIVPTAVPLLERLTEDAEDARWRWGTFRVSPSVGISDLAWVDDAFADSDETQAKPEGDLNVNLFTGLNFYQLLGDHAALGFFVRPEYSWWQDLEERRRLNLSVGAAATLNFNRVFFNGEINRLEDQGKVTEEAEQSINARRDLVDLTLGIPIYRSLAVSASYQRAETENLLGETPSGLIPDFTRLDSTTETTIVGIQFEPGRNTTVRIGYGDQQSTANNILRDFEGEGPTLEVKVNQETFSLVAFFQDFDLQPTGISNFSPYSDFTGALTVIFGSATGRSLILSADRAVSASIRSGFDDFESTRFTIGSVIPLSQRVSIQGRYSTGERDFRQSNRTDDTQEISTDLRFHLVGQTALSLGYQHSEIDSSNPSFDRKLDRITIRFSVGLSGLAWP